MSNILFNTNSCRFNEMVSCPEFGESFTNAECILKHLQETHSKKFTENKIKYCCKEDDCERLFPNWNSFSQHLKKFHKASKIFSVTTSSTLSSIESTDENKVKNIKLKLIFLNTKKVTLIYIF